MTLIPKRVKDGDAIPVVKSTAVLPIDDDSFSKGYKITLEQINGYGRALIDFTWNMWNSWYSPVVSLPFDKDSFLGFETQAIFDDDGNAYPIHNVYDSNITNASVYTRDEIGKKMDANSRTGFITQVIFNYVNNTIQAQFFYPFIIAGLGLNDDRLQYDNGWGTRTTIPSSCLASSALVKFRGTTKPRMRIIIRYSVPLNE